MRQQPKTLFVHLAKGEDFADHYALQERGTGGAFRCSNGRTMVAKFREVIRAVHTQQIVQRATRQQHQTAASAKTEVTLGYMMI
jgi:hypothetical protein